MVAFHRGTQWIGVTALLVLALAGCSPSAGREQALRLLHLQPAVASSPAPANPANRILVQGQDGNLYITTPDGKERFALTSDASAQRFYGQASWSPDGQALAWSALSSDGSKLETSRFDGTQRRSVEVPYLPFYVAWSPNGRQLAYLSNWEAIDGPSMALRLVDVSPDGSTATTLATGQPLYFSWSPGGEQLLAHIDNERVEVYDVAGGVKSLAISGGLFSSPAWAATGEQLVYAVADQQTQRLLLTDLAGQPLETLTDYQGRVSFSLSPDGSSVAYVATDSGGVANTLGPLYVVETSSLRTREITDRPVLAFYWSPDASKLAFLAFEAVNGRVGLRWHVWDGRLTRPYAAFFPSRSLLRDYLPYFDQYAQSHRIWAPDSSAFVFAGTLENGRSGIWVQKVDGKDAEPLSLGPGVSAIWSPIGRR